MNLFKYNNLILLLILSYSTYLCHSQEASSTTESVDDADDDSATTTADPTTTLMAMQDKVTKMIMAMTEASTTVSTTTSTTTRKPTTTKRTAPLTPCELQFRKSDNCTRQALFLAGEADYSSIVIPKDVEAMTSYCREKIEDVNCIKEYGTKCLKNVPRQVYMSIMKNIRKLFQTYCKTDVGKRAFIGHLECIKTEHLKILNEVLGKLTIALDYSAEKVPRAEIITYACCSLHRTYDEIPSAMANICAPRQTPRETIKFFQSLIKGAVGDVLDVGCGRYASLEYCDANFKAGMANIRGAVASAKSLPEESFIVPLVKFTKKIDSGP